MHGRCLCMVVSMHGRCLCMVVSMLGTVADGMPTTHTFFPHLLTLVADPKRKVADYMTDYMIPNGS